jgi:hypothetical protein
MLRVVTQSLYVLLGGVFLLGGTGVLLLGTGLLPIPENDIATFKTPHVRCPSNGNSE